MSKKSPLLQPKQMKGVRSGVLLCVRCSVDSPLKSVEVYQFTSVKLNRT